MLRARLWDLLPALVTWAVTTSLFGYPWQLALLTSVAVGALGYSTRRTISNLRGLGGGASFTRVDAPGEDSESGRE